MADITSSNSVLTISADGVFDTPQQLQGFAQDDAYSMSEIKISENVIGVDGVKSSGFLPTMKPMDIILQADSPSNDFFETIFNAQENSQSLIILAATLDQPSLGKSYTLTNGTIENYTPLAQAKKTLQPRRFSIVWQAASGADTGE